MSIWLTNHPSFVLRAIVAGHGPSANRRGDPVDSGKTVLAHRQRQAFSLNDTVVAL